MLLQGMISENYIIFGVTLFQELWYIIEVTLSKDRGYNITAICCSTYYMMLDAAVKLP